MNPDSLTMNPDSTAMNPDSAPMNPDSLTMNPDSTPVNHDSTTTDRNSPSGVEPHSGGINMAAGYIPRNDAEFLAWMNNFISVLNANLATFGLVAADLTPLTNARNDFQTKLGNFQTAETAFRTASEAKKTSRNTAEPLFRQMAQRINRHPAMTNALRAQLGLTVPKPRQRRGVGPEIPGVRLEVDAGRVVVHFGTNPDDETRNGKPDWAIGANIYIKAEDEADYRLLAFDTASPYVWEYRGAPKRFSFRVAYRGVRERDEGTLSPEETVSVGG
jgi:hypothetical protein